MACAIITKAGEPYVSVTRKDMHALAQMMVGESSDPIDREAQLWTIAQRFVLRDKRYEDTIEELVWSFSQPVNPKWRRDGTFCKPGGQYHGTSHCSERKLARREQIASLSKGDPRYDEAYALVERWVKGQVPNPVERSVDWHAWRLAEGNTRIGSYPNIFQATPRSMGWPDGYVGLVPKNCGPSWLPYAAGAAGLAFFGGVVYFTAAGAR